MTLEVRLELQRLLSGLCDGELAADDSARLEELLAADAKCRRLYLEYIDTHARLLVHPRLSGGDPLLPDGGRPGAAPAEPTAPPALGVRTEPVGRRPAEQALRYTLVAVGTLAASLLVQVAWWASRPQAVSPEPVPAGLAAEAGRPAYIATLTQSPDCAWENPGEAWRSGSRLTPGVLRLLTGVARVRFDIGSELLLEGPAAVSLDSGTSATVLRGKVVFRADETAATFDLRTPTASLIHLGTEYAVAVGPEGEEVHVFEGKVERTPRPAGGTERIAKGEARHYGRPPGAPGQPTPFDPARFVRQLVSRGQPADPADGLLAYDGFDYPDAEAFMAGRCNGGFGWAGPWLPDFARPLNPGDTNRLTFNPARSLDRPGAAVPPVGGCFDYTGFTKCFRRLARPVRLDDEGVYYLSFLFRRQGPPADPINAVAILLWTEDDFRQKSEDPRRRLNIGVRGENELFTHLQQVGTRTPLPLNDGVTYLLVAKIVASIANPDQVFMRVYGPREPIERDEPGSWTVVGPPFESDLVFDWLQLHVNSKRRQMLDEVRLGTTWSSVTAPWIGRPAAQRGRN